MEHFDVVVCGLGAMGAATVHHLAKRGVRVLGIDRFTPPHDRGSTHGATRVTRLAIGEGLAYVPLAMRSHQLWRDLEHDTGAELLTTNGVLILASPGPHTRHNGKSRFLETTIEAARSFSIEHEVLTATEISARFPQFRLSGGETGYFEPGGGLVRPEAAVAAQLRLAAEHGAVIHSDETIVRYQQQSDGVTLATTRGDYAAGVLVLAVGAWLGEILGEPYAADFAITRQLLHWYAVAATVDPFLPDRFPVFIWDDSGGGFYGFPAIDGRGGGVKVAAESSVRSASVADVRREVSPAERFHLYDTFVKDRLPGLARDCVRVATCMYTTTPDGDFVVDRHPEHPSVMVISACSGHGFKHSPALGEAVAAGIVGETAVVDLSPFAFARLQRSG
ncbi:MAG: N-methyl-L-tryptophan oxidase [Candidatus Dormibacteria bacterium]